MPEGKWTDIETAKKVLKNSCDFLEKDETADFKIRDGREAVLMSIYTPTFFILNEELKFQFRPILNSDSAKEPLCLTYLETGMTHALNEIPMFGIPLSFYFRFFPDLHEPKHLFLIDQRSYNKRQHWALHYMMKDVLEKIRAGRVNQADCMVWISNAEGQFGEEFWDYVSGLVLRNKGYFITRYAAAHRGYGRDEVYGTGDLSAYYIPEYIDRMTERGFLNRGAFIEELEMLQKRYDQSTKPVRSDFESVIVESESSDSAIRNHTNSGVGQIVHKYFSVESGYSHGVVSGPFCTGYDDIHCQDEKCTCKSVGLISCDDKGNLVYLPPKRRYLEPTQIEARIRAIKNLIRSILLKNITFEERNRLMGTCPTNIKDYLEKILNLELDTILDSVEQKIA